MTDKKEAPRQKSMIGIDLRALSGVQFCTSPIHFPAFMRSHMSSKETVLITGASSGIGLELAKLFAADGSQLILAARSADKLQQLAEELNATHGTQSHVIPVDLAKPEGPGALMEQIDALGLAVDVLINNAGFGQYGHFANIPMQRQLEILDVNNRALVELTHRVLTGMLERRSGSILNLGSTASFQPGPNSAVYYATKAFVLSFSEGLWAETRKQGVCVSCLCPGPTRTGFGADSDMDQTPVFKYNSMRVEDVAKAGHRAVRKRKRLVIPGWVNWLLAFGTRLPHRRHMIWIMEQLQPPKKTS